MKEKYLMNLPKELKEFLQKLAKKKGYSLNAMILKVLWDYKENSNNLTN